MESFGFAGLVLNDHLTNPSSYNKITMTNSTLTSLSSVQVVGHKRKRSSLPNMLSETAGRAKNLLKRFKSSFGSPNHNVSFPPSKNLPDHALLPIHSKDQARLSSWNEKMPIVEKIGLDDLETYDIDVLRSGTLVASRSPKTVCYDSMSSTKWSQLEISMSPAKHTSGVRMLSQQQDGVHKSGVFCDSSNVHASRMLCWDQVTKDDSINKVTPTWSCSVGSDHMMVSEQRMPYMNGTRRATLSNLDFCKAVNISNATNPSPLKAKIENEDFLQHGLQTRCSIDSYDTLSIKHKNLFTNSTNTFTVEKVYSEAAVFKAVLDDSGFFSENIDTSLETMVKPAARYFATKAAKGKGKTNSDVESYNSKVVETSNLNKALKSIQIKSTRSLLFLPFPNVPFKIKAIYPLNARFQVSYIESSTIPNVTTAGEVFEAKLQEITRNDAGREAFRNSSSNFSCSIKVETTDASEKFEEIKNALRFVSGAYNIGVQGFMATESSIKTTNKGHGEQAEQVSPVTNPRCGPPVFPGSADLCEVLLKQRDLLASNVDRDSVPSGAVDMGHIDIEQVTACGSQDCFPELAVSIESKGGGIYTHSTDSPEAERSVRRSRRKVKAEGLWKERNAYATRITRPNSSHGTVNCPHNYNEDHTYLDQTFIVNQFIQDITGVPVVVLERLSSKNIHKFSSLSSTT